jgi:hypothetical protein
MTLKFAVGQKVRVTAGDLPTPIDTEFVITGATELEDRHFGPNYYVGEGAEQGVWERFLKAVDE